MEEKRRFPRFTVEVQVHWKKISDAKERTAQHISHSKDASVGGICLVLHPGIVMGDTLQLNIHLPGGRVIRARGKVAWINPEARVKGRVSTVYEGGIQFMEMSDADKNEISHFIATSSQGGSRK